MSNEEDKKCNLKVVDLLSAMKQSKVSEKQIAEDIKLLLDDYFVGTSEINGNRIGFTLLNGQKFNLTVEKAKKKLNSRKKI